jgi:hypothetical protein
VPDTFVPLPALKYHIMKKTVLIPTDFSIESLHLLKSFLGNSHENDTFDIVLLHGLQLSDSITELLFFSKSKTIAKLADNNFNEACKVILNKYASRVSSFRKDIFTGFTQSAFNNYIEANSITEAYVPADYRMDKISKGSFDIVPFIQKSHLKIGRAEWTSGQLEKGNLAEIFFSSVSTTH